MASAGSPSEAEIELADDYRDTVWTEVQMPMEIEEGNTDDDRDTFRTVWDCRPQLLAPDLAEKQR